MIFFALKNLSPNQACGILSDELSLFLGGFNGFIGK